jgi:hypothetical protein
VGGGNKLVLWFGHRMENNLAKFLKYEGQNWPGLAKFQPATEIDQLQLTFFVHVSKIESGYFFLWNMIGMHT